MEQKPTNKKPPKEKLGGMPTGLVRGVGPFYPITKAYPISGTIERRMIDGTGNSEHGQIMLGTPHMRMLLTASHMLHKKRKRHPGASEITGSLTKFTRQYGLTKTGDNLRKVRGILKDWQRVHFIATLPYGGTVYDFDKIMLVNLPHKYGHPDEIIYVNFNTQFVDALVRGHATLYEIEFMSRWTDGYTALIYAYIQSQRAFYIGTDCVIREEELFTVLGADHLVRQRNIPLWKVRQRVQGAMERLHAVGYFAGPLPPRLVGGRYVVQAARPFTQYGVKEARQMLREPSLNEVGAMVRDAWEELVGAGGHAAHFNYAGALVMEVHQWAIKLKLLHHTVTLPVLARRFVKFTARRQTPEHSGWLLKVAEADFKNYLMEQGTMERPLWAVRPEDRY